MDEKAVNALIQAALIPCNAEIANLKVCVETCYAQMTDLKVRVEMLDEDIRVLAPDKIRNMPAQN